MSIAVKSTKANQRNNGLKLICTYKPKLLMNNELGHPFLPFTRFLKALAQPVDVKGNMTNYEKKDNYTDSYFSASECFFAIPAQ